jgi:hypothetical protein
MQRAILIVLLFGLFAQMAPAQPVSSDEPSVEPTYDRYGERGAYGTGNRAGRGEYRVDPRQTHRLVERWKASKQDAEREKVEGDLRNVLKREFAARLSVHEREIKELEEKVRQLRERLTLRKEKQDEIVEHRLQQILRDAQGLGWGSEGAGASATYRMWHTTTEAAAPAATEDLFGPATTTTDVPHEPEGAEDLFGGEAPSVDLEFAPK